eukprot:s637_g15.t5
MSLTTQLPGAVLRDYWAEAAMPRSCSCCETAQPRLAAAEHGLWVLPLNGGAEQFAELETNGEPPEKKPRLEPSEAPLAAPTGSKLSKVLQEL